MRAESSHPISLSSLASDLRQAARQIYKAPAFAATVVLLLAAGFGVSVAIFSIVRNVLLNPLPYRDPGRLVQIVSWWPKTGDQNGWSAPLRDALDWKTMVPAFQDVAMYHYDLRNLTGKGQAESVYGLRVTANLLPMLGVRPALGNWFTADHDLPGNTHVILLSDDLWRRKFGADREIVGKTIHLDDESYEVFGVMPRGFNFPLKLGTTALLPTDQMQHWMPLEINLAKEQHGTPDAGVIAKLKPGVTLSEAQAELENACRLLEREYPKTNRGLSARIFSLRQQTVKQVNRPLLALLAATGLILLLACANVSGLLLARGAARSGELAIRMALGGSGWQVARIPLLEGVLLCCCGCLLGVPVAMVTLRLLLRLAPIDVPRLASTSIDFSAVLFAALLAIVCGALVGGVNAMQVLGRSPREVLSESSRTSLGRPRARLRSSLVASQVAVSVVLLCVAGLMLRTLANLLSTDTGYRADHVYYAVTVLPPARYGQPEQRHIFFSKVLEQLRSTPRIEAAGVSTGFPFVGQYDGAKAQSEGMFNTGTEGIDADSNDVSPGYLEAMGVRLTSGRLIEKTDTGDAPKIAVIDETLARKLWPGENPIGQRINVDDPAKPVWRQVVGVLQPMRNFALDMKTRPGVFIPADQSTGYVNFVVVKSPDSVREVARSIRNAVAGVDADQGVFFVQSMPELIGGTIAVRRFLFTVLVFFAGAALLLSAFGIYGLISFVAASRIREVGIRMALGATRKNIVRLVLSEGIRLTLFGAVAGLIASAIAGRALSGMLFGVRGFDWMTMAAAVLAPVLVAAVAALVPALRSSRVEPMAALRTE
ncbi:MAG TPA: ABC transporter permease [Terracidiphilus sp.]|nr:ABC transporter permease [Terracidiphilus sp.]